MPKTKWYSNPYHDEIYKAQKQKEEIDNEIVYCMARILAFMMTLGVIYFLFRQ